MCNVEKNAPFPADKIDGQLAAGEKIPSDENVMWFKVGEDGEFRYRLNPAWVDQFAPVCRDALGFSSQQSGLPAIIRRSHAKPGQQPMANAGMGGSSVNERRNILEKVWLRFWRLIRRLNIDLKHRS